MTDRTDLPKIKPTDAPTIFNQEAGKRGFLFGTVASLATIPVIFSETFKATRNSLRSGAPLNSELALLPKMKNMLLFVTGAEIVGAVWGGLAGKEKQEKEQVEGRTVKNPGYLNAGIFSGMLVSGLIRAPFMLATMTAEGAKKPMGFLVTTVVPWVSIITGSVMRKNSLQRDFDTAVALRDQETNQLKETIQGLKEAAAAPPSFKNSVNAEEAARLESKQKPAVSHAEKQAAQTTATENAADLQRA